MAVIRATFIAAALGLATLPATAQTLGDTGAPAAADDGYTFGTQNRPQRTIFFSALFGVQSGPAYFGSDEMEFGPAFRGGVGYLNFGAENIGQTDLSEDPYERQAGFGYGMSFRFIGGRDADDHDELRGLDDIDPTVEIGGALAYAWPSFETLVQARYGIGGSDAWVGEVRMNYVARPTENLTLRVGPRFLLGSDRYVDTYFGVSSAESARSDFAAYDPDAGLVSAGVEAIASYRLADRWWLEGAVRWDRFLGDAADSPIVRAGSEDSTRVRIGLRRTFTLRF